MDWFTYSEVKALLLTIGRFAIADYDHYGLTVLDAESGLFAIGSDEEADDAWVRGMESYFDECVLPEVPDHLQSYIDEDKWMDDAKMDGRGHVLSTYDGTETQIEDLVLFHI